MPTAFCLGFRTSRLVAFSVIEVHHIRRKTLSTKKDFWQTNTSHIIVKSFFNKVRRPQMKILSIYEFAFFVSAF